MMIEKIITILRIMMIMTVITIMMALLMKGGLAMPHPSGYFPRPYEDFSASALFISSPPVHC